jgi:hypothetical protein
MTLFKSNLPSPHMLTFAKNAKNRKPPDLREKCGQIAFFTLDVDTIAEAFILAVCFQYRPRAPNREKNSAPAFGSSSKAMAARLMRVFIILRVNANNVR